MKHIRKINEEISGDYLMILHAESGDEIHIDLIEMSHYPNIDRLLNIITSREATTEYDELIEYIFNNRVGPDMMCQTYVLEDYLFSGYNIVKAINIPELGA